MRNSYEKISPAEISARSLFKRGTASPTPLGIAPTKMKTPTKSIELRRKTNDRPDLVSPGPKVSPFTKIKSPVKQAVSARGKILSKTMKQSTLISKTMMADDVKLL